MWPWPIYLRALKLASRIAPSDVDDTDWPFEKKFFFSWERSAVIEREDFLYRVNNRTKMYTSRKRERERSTMRGRGEDERANDRARVNDKSDVVARHAGNTIFLQSLSRIIDPLQRPDDYDSARLNIVREARGWREEGTRSKKRVEFSRIDQTRRTAKETEENPWNVELNLGPNPARFTERDLG